MDFMSRAKRLIDWGDQPFNCEQRLSETTSFCTPCANVSEIGNSN